MTNPYEPPESNPTDDVHDPMQSQVSGKVVLVGLVSACILFPFALWAITLVLSNWSLIIQRG
jgi:hypothetical protein